MVERNEHFYINLIQQTIEKTLMYDFEDGESINIDHVARAIYNTLWEYLKEDD